MLPGGPCRCFHCLHTFLAETITRWIDEDETALCPRCGVDAAVSSFADALSDALISELQAAYFGSGHAYTEQEWKAGLTRKQRGVAARV